MRLKQHIDILDFLKTIHTCKGEVLLKTDEGDILNLSSMLSQYIFISNAENQDFFIYGIVECSNPDDEGVLARFLY